MKINFVGDICLNGFDYRDLAVDSEIIGLLKSADCNCGNLESPLTHSTGKSSGRAIYLKGLPEKNVIIDHFDVFSLANNHIMDYGLQGLQDTLSFLSRNNKKYFGAGNDVREAEKPLYIEHYGKKIAFVGLTRYQNAGANKPGTAPYKIKKLEKIINGIKQDNYFVVVMPHWNYQWVSYPSPYDWGNAHRMIDAGADLIVGAHPHVVQGIEEYRGKFIFHSLGNFAFQRTKYSQNISIYGKTFILSIEIKADNNYSYEIINVFSDGSTICLMRPDESEEFNRHLHTISKPLYDRKILSREFYNLSVEIDDLTNKVFGDIARDHGYLSVIKDLLRANRQDIKKRLYSTYIKAIRK